MLALSLLSEKWHALEEFVELLWEPGVATFLVTQQHKVSFACRGFCFDISGTNALSFSAGFRLTQLLDFEEGSGIVLRSAKIQLMYKVIEDDTSNLVSAPVSQTQSGESKPEVRQWAIATVEAEAAGFLALDPEELRRIGLDVLLVDS
ncbi:hypothetical protein AK812_SmicGene27336 [Symbiodinium microadriaticum]|uniref:Uncharacterized protein n=1 Tax=Symbiodinium microadriaticum TaxID=2951 RepID=A0A1Q9D7A3_SYMMI|nr:hypothetical protein AK812_SmicGene27336 [Symbiodinium microadriaticum]